MRNITPEVMEILEEMNKQVYTPKTRLNEVLIFPDRREACEKLLQGAMFLDEFLAVVNNNDYHLDFMKERGVIEISSGRVTLAEPYKTLLAKLY